MFSSKFFNRVISRSVRLTIFFVPLFFLPFTFEYFEFNKQNLLFVLISVGLLAWAAKMIFVEKKLSWRKTPLEIPLLVFLAVTWLSALFAVDRHSAFLGYYGRFSDNWLQLFFLISLVALIINNHLASLRLEKILGTFLRSGALVVVSSWAIIIGNFNRWTFLPGYLKTGLFTPVGASFEALAVFAACFAVLLISLFYFYAEESRKKSSPFIFKKTFLSVLLLPTLALIFFINFSGAWAVLLLSILLLISFLLVSQGYFVKRPDKERFYKIPILASLVFILGAASLLLSLSPAKNKLSREIILSWENSLAVAVKQLPKDPFLGVGPGNYAYAFSFSRPESLNQGELWQIRFDKSGSHLLEIVSTYGILGAGAYFFLLITFIFVFLRLAPRFYGAGRRQYLAIFFAWLALLFSQLFYLQNMVLSLSFWLFVALGALAWKKVPLKNILAAREFSFVKKPEWGAVLAGVFFIACLVWLGLAFLLVRYYRGDFKYAQLERSRAEGSAALETMDRVVALAPWEAKYWLARGKIYLVQINAMVTGQQIYKQEDSERLARYIDAAIKSGKEATDLEASNALVWESLGNTYKEIRGLASGSDVWMQESFKKAAEIEPSNPAFALEAGKAYLASVAGGQYAKTSQELKMAEDYLQKAINLKGDYKEAKLYLAVVREEQENIPDAMAILENLIRDYPRYIDAYFQLGRVYFNQNKVEQAIEQFKKAIALEPNHSNARYSLGVAYMARQQDSLALEQFKKVLELNPGNRDVIDKIKEIESVVQK